MRFVNEDIGHLDALFANHLELRAADERGTLLDGSLMDHVITLVSGRRSVPRPWCLTITGISTRIGWIGTAGLARWRGSTGGGRRVPAGYIAGQ